MYQGSQRGSETQFARLPGGESERNLRTLLPAFVLLVAAALCVPAGTLVFTVGAVPDGSISNDATLSTVPAEATAAVPSPPPLACANCVVGNLPVGSAPLAVAYDGENQEVYVANIYSSNVSVLAGTSVVGAVGTGTGPQALAYDSHNGDVYVATHGTNDVDVISSANSLVATVPVGTNQEGDGYDVDNEDVYVADTTANEVSVLSSGNAVVATVPVGDGPLGIATDSASGVVYVTNNYGGSNITVISGSSNRVVGSIDVGCGPNGIAFDSVDGNLYVTNQCSDNVSVISGTTDAVVGTIAVGSGPTAIALDSGNGELYVANRFSDNVSVIAPWNSTVVATIPVGSNPLGIGYNPADGDVYVANWASNNVTVINGSASSPTVGYSVGNLTSTINPDLVWAGQEQSSGAGLIVSGGNGLISTTGGSNTSPTLLLSGSSGYTDFVQPLGADLLVGGTFYGCPGGARLFSYSPSNGSVSDTSSLLPEGWTTSGTCQDLVAESTGDQSTLAVLGQNTPSSGGTGRPSVALLSGSTFTNVTSEFPSLPAMSGVGGCPYCWFTAYGGGAYLLVTDGYAYQYAPGGSVRNLSAQLSGSFAPTLGGQQDVAWSGTEFLVGYAHQVSAYDPTSGNTEAVFTPDAGTISFVNYVDGEVWVGVSQNDLTNVYAAPGSAPSPDAFREAASGLWGIEVDAAYYNGSVWIDGTEFAGQGPGGPGCGCDSVLYSLTPVTSAPGFSLTVEVVDSGDNPLSGAIVSANNSTVGTDAGGIATFYLPRGTFSVTASDPTYTSSSQVVNLEGNLSVLLTLARPYDMLGELPASDLNSTESGAGWKLSILSPFATSPADVFFDWQLVGTLPAGAGWMVFGAPNLPTLVVVAAEPGSAEYPDAWYATPVSPVLTPTNGTSGAFLAESVPYAAGSISVYPDPPVHLQNATISVILHDPYNVSLNISRIDFQVLGLNVGDSGWSEVGELNNVILAPGETSTFSVPWFVATSGHHCVRIVLTYPGDPPTQQLQHNYDVEPDQLSGQTGSVSFTLGNPTESTADVTLQVGPQAPWPSGWTTSLTLNGETYGQGSFVLPSVAPGPMGSATLSITPSAGSPGTGTVDVSEWIGGALVGGIRKALTESPPSVPYIFTATPVPLSPSNTTDPSSALQPSTFLSSDGFCGASSASSLAGCAALTWNFPVADGCPVTLATNDSLVSSSQSLPCQDSLDVPIPSPNPSGGPLQYFVFTITQADVPSTLDIYTLPTVTESSDCGGSSGSCSGDSSLSISSEYYDPITCNHLVNLLGCWIEIGAGSSDSFGIPVSAIAGEGYSLGGVLGAATATYPGVALPSGYATEYYTLANTWTAHVEYCVAEEGGSGVLEQTFAYDDTGSTFASPGDSAVCAHLIAGEAGDDVQDLLSSVTGYDTSSLPDLGDLVSAAGTLASGLLDTTECADASGQGALGTACSVLSNLESENAELEDDSGFYGAEWSSELPSACTYTVSAGPLAAESSIGFATSAAEVDASIVQTTISGIAVPTSTSGACPEGSISTPSQITLTTPDAFYGGQSLILGTLTDSDGDRISGSQVHLAVSLGSLSESTVMTTSTGTFSVAYTAPVSGVSDAPVTITATDDGASTTQTFDLLNLVTSPVAFTETGLPAATLAKDGWTVELNGQTRHSVSPTITFDEPAGEFPYLITGPSGYRDVGGSGTLGLSGNATTVAPRLTRGPTFTLTFRERGLGHRQPWCVALDAAEECSVTSSVRFLNLTSATYGYALVSPLAGQTIEGRVEGAAVGTTGNLTVDRSETVSFAFAYLYNVTFDQQGLTAGTWSITLRGHTETAAWDAAIEFTLPNGSYPYKVAKETGYRSTAPKVAVAGAPSAATVVFTKSKR